MSVRVGTGSRNEKGAQESQKSYVALTRILSNLVAGALVFLSVATLIVLLSQNMFARTIVSANAQTEGFFWAPYGQSCMLNANGFVPNTCSAVEESVIVPAAWTAVGVALAQQWSLELAKASPLYITTCIIGGSADVGWANLEFIAGYAAFPECLPTNGAQPVAGMMMLETTIREKYPEGVYLMTLYSDLTPDMQLVQNYVNTDGSVAPLIENVKRTVITQAGGIENDLLGSDYIITSRPLGNRYLVTSACHTEIEELSGQISALGLTGWSQGAHSKLPIVPGWNCGHDVANANELIAIQVIFAVMTLLLLSGDLLTTYQGLKGVLGGKPVLTYAILSGLERRKLLMVCILVNAMPGLLYMDVSRIYFFTENGFKIWSLSALMVASFVSFGWLLAVSLLDWLCRPLRSLLGQKCLTYSAPLYMYASIAAIFWSCAGDRAVFQTVYNAFLRRRRLYINNATWPRGAYVAEGTPAVVTWLESQILVPLIASWAASLGWRTLHRIVYSRRFFLHTSWCSTNSFLSHVMPPTCLTTLPLEQSNAIKIGNRIFCKPSTMALMGYACVVESKYVLSLHCISLMSMPSDYAIISIYALLPSLIAPAWLPWRTRVIGYISSNMFKVQTKTTLDKLKAYSYSRGTCIS
ncbi:hypothetical protein SPRG_00565 [Saprolegnia parasitica CBS 223.65]|uniref:Uncharacterized protein n=1 Tax=Saprolegnia parasitica (strain CBS 223.65) TaxID=695850 RepID=A0A067D665_SAPPC|nr:hypothetical protein SPRG_00565 [Saprolegnia parasitica CBS 223.65]KDO34502.1 hypothetical protein SPRG_00565 [Saprolegnia parasitica CBS 223.65]|eukprot:XP_012194181.1 hypothetical protein SPRG_00565 [Saprolegnia parasitica CBS 223.65]